MWCSPTSALGARVHLKIKSNIEYFYHHQWLWQFSLLEPIFFFFCGHLACVASTKQMGEKKNVVKTWEFCSGLGLLRLWPMNSTPNFWCLLSACVPESTNTAPVVLVPRGRVLWTQEWGTGNAWRAGCCEIIWCSLIRVASGNAFWGKPSVTRPLHSFGDALGMIQSGDRISVNWSGVSGIQHYGELCCESILDTDK